MTDELLDGTIHLLIQCTKENGTTITRVARCTRRNDAPTKTHSAFYTIRFFEDPGHLSRMWMGIERGQDCEIALCRAVSDCVEKRLVNKCNPWTVAVAVIDEDEAVECRIALEVV
jgi:hypothetical protein